MSSPTRQFGEVAPCDRPNQGSLKSCLAKTPRYSDIGTGLASIGQGFPHVDASVSGDVPYCTKNAADQVRQLASQCDCHRLESEGVVLPHCGKAPSVGDAHCSISVSPALGQPGLAKVSYPSSDTNAELQDVRMDMPCVRMDEKGLLDGPQSTAGADGCLLLPGIANRRKGDLQNTHGYAIGMGDESTFSEASTGTGSNSTGLVFSLRSAAISGASTLGSLDRYENQFNLGPFTRCPYITNMNVGCEGEEATTRHESTHKAELPIPSLSISNPTENELAESRAPSRLSLPIPSIRTSEPESVAGTKEPSGLLLPGIPSVRNSPPPTAQETTEVGQWDASGTSSLRIVALARSPHPKPSSDIQALPWRVKYLPSRGAVGQVSDVVGGVVSSHECLTDDTTADGCQDYEEEEDDDEIADGSDVQLPDGVGKKVRFAPLVPTAIYEYEQYDWEAETYEAEEVFGRRSFEAVSPIEGSTAPLSHPIEFSGACEPAESNNIVEAPRDDGIEADPSRMFIPLIGGGPSQPGEEDEASTGSEVSSEDDSAGSKRTACSSKTFSFDDSGRLSNASTRRAVKDRERTPHPSRQPSISSQFLGETGADASSPFFPFKAAENFGLSFVECQSDIAGEPDQESVTLSPTPHRPDVLPKATTEGVGLVLMSTPVTSNGLSFLSHICDSEGFATPSSHISQGFVTPSSVRACFVESASHGQNPRQSIDLMSIDSTEFLVPMTGSCWRSCDPDSSGMEQGRYLLGRCVQVPPATVATRNAEWPAALRFGVLSVASDDADDGDVSTTSQSLRLPLASPREPSAIEAVKAPMWASHDPFSGFFTPMCTVDPRDREKQQDAVDSKTASCVQDEESLPCLHSTRPQQGLRPDQLCHTCSQGNEKGRSDGIEGLETACATSTPSWTSTRIFNAGSSCSTPSSQRTCSDSSCRFGCAAASSIQEQALPRHVCKNSAAFTAC